MKKVITYGTFDLFHEGHYRLLERAKKLGDYLVVGVTTENYDESRGKLNVQESLMQRIENVKKSGFADEIIIEEYEGQKINDIQRHNVEIFAIGSDWMGQFDYLKEYCEVVYLERTKGVSSTQIRDQHNGILRMGIIGNGRIANRFVRESKFVSGVNIEGVFGRNLQSLKRFCDTHKLGFFETDLKSFLKKVDAVYVASPHLTHYEYIMKALDNRKHVLCEKPIVLNSNQVEQIFSKASKNNCVLLEAIKTAFSPGFIRLVSLAKSGLIGKIKSVEATFTKIEEGDVRELKPESAGGSVTELASYPLLAITKLLGNDIQGKRYFTYFDPKSKVDLFTKILLKYQNALATATVGLGVKSEGELIISGTKGYVYVPAPWWKTEYFEIRYEDSNKNKRYFFKYEGDGLRYELSEFVSLINKNNLQTYKLTSSDSMAICRIINDFLDNKGVEII